MTATDVIIRAKRRLGQHFLRDERILTRIADAAELAPGDTVVEIGPGTGNLTTQLLDRAGKVVAVEIDERLQPVLGVLETTRESFRVVWGDFMDLEWASLGLSSQDKVKVVANIPYYITTPILLKLLQEPEISRRPLTEVPPLAERFVIMVQDEVAERMIAQPGTKAYGSLSVIVQYAARVERVFKVPRHVFVPRPQVESAVLRLFPRHEPPMRVADPRVFFRVVRGSFGQRRKTLLNALSAAAFVKADVAAACQAADIDPQRRGETLTLDEFARLAAHLH
ncbi:MAG: 16S rRNA (adenine(1518)-N(6)/adenine(1519)-N(6))-dimethyltransferase RsmA [Candidatus Sericytochromatia bacterium]|uniref:Ribosomal RNA small subunit methyltransferase A n=1 Tax=Candidatus Tanganyikabacteria bacterium TaxID=2961651 RepID=A0A937X032_9BACT|nr:16S rRNA (adenine(1518)-N(6)/adenine(1519)-N(6))-dimethyltransferase RsmA [Candidatus Tanganyikabacteria bacterium]